MSLAALFTTSVAVASAAFAAAPQNRFTPQRREYEYCDKQIRDLLSPDYFQTICLRPEYQRHIRWKPAAMNNFIDSVMMKRYIMPVLMYRLHPSDLIGKYSQDTLYENEVMDGHHRLYTLNAFKSAKKQKLPYVAKEFIVHWRLEQKDDSSRSSVTHIFYERTDDVEDWCKAQDPVITPEYLTTEGKKLFNNTIIKLTTITSKLTLDERRAEFMSLQNGVPVRGSDLLKNEVGCKLIVQFNIHGYEDLMDKVFINCTKKAPKFWANWAAKCYLLQKDTSTNPSNTFLIRDPEISKWIKESRSILNPSEDEFEKFHEKFLDFIEFLSNLGESVTFNPTQLFAVFYHLCQQCNHDVVRSYMRNFSKEGQVRAYKNLWEKDDCEPRRQYFNDCIGQLSSMQEPAMPYDDRPISSSLKKKVWKKCVDGRCYVCDNEISNKQFESGHIVARARGGQTELDNLVAMCFDCNRSMGTRNANEYKKDKYPYIA